MQFVELDQRTDAWFEWRKNGITASESPVIVIWTPKLGLQNKLQVECGRF